MGPPHLLVVIPIWAEKAEQLAALFLDVLGVLSAWCRRR
jgi:hypothetical protein